jgi:eukaryotic-like serine/threonine-protein kinase
VSRSTSVFRISGRQAFSKSSTIETMWAIVRDEPAPLDAPLKLSTIITRCLRKAPAERFQTAAEVRIALEGAVAKPDVPGLKVIARTSAFAFRG